MRWIQRKGRESGKGESSTDVLKARREEVELARSALQERHTKWAEWRDYCGPDGQREALQALLDDDEQEDAVAANLIFAVQEAQTANLVAAMQAPVVIEVGGEQPEDAARVTAYLQAWVDKRQVPEELRQVFVQAFQVGTGVAKVFVDKQSDDVTFEAVDPASVYPDPAATRPHRCSFIALRHVLSEALCREWFGDTFDAERAQAVEGSDAEDISAQEEQEQGVTDKGSVYEVWEHYWDFGRKLTIYSGNLVLYDGENPTPGQQYPVFFFTAHKTPHQFWGESTVAYLMDLQNQANKARTAIARHQRLTSGMAWVTDDPQLKENLDLSAGAVNLKNPQGDLSPVPIHPLPAEVVETLYLSQAAIDTVSGIPEITRGVRPKGVTSGISLEVLQQAAQARMSGPARSWTYVLQAAYQCALEMMQEHYGVARQLPLWRNGMPQLVDLEPQLLSVTEPAGALETDEWGRPMQPMRTRPREYLVTMEPDGRIPHSPAALVEMSLRLWEDDLIPHTDEGRILVLNACHYPGRDRLLQAMSEQAAQRMQGRMDGAELAALLQQAGSPPEGLDSVNVPEY